MSDHPSPPPAVNPYSHPGPPPPGPGVNPFSHPGSPPKDISAISRSSSSSDSPLTELSSPSVPVNSDAAASVPIKVQLRHTREIVCEKPVKNTSFSSKATIVDIVPFSGTPKTITLVGNAPGDTHVTFLFTDGTADRLPVSVAF